MIADPIREGIAAGWKMIDAAALERDLRARGRRGRRRQRRRAAA